jgi:hypothetical protein
MGLLDNVSRWGRWGLTPSEKTAILVPIKLPGDPPFVGASFSSHPAHVPPLLFRNLLISLLWISGLISMASACTQSIAY